MPNKTINFTIDALDGLKPAEKGKRYSVYDKNLPALSLRITDSGHKSFVLLLKHNGRVLRITLGTYPKTTIAQARKKAIDKLHDIGEGKNPNQEKKKYNQESTLGQLFNDFMKRYSIPNKKSWIYDEREIPRFLGHWFARKISDITKQQIQAWFETMTHENGLYQANRSLERLRAMYNKGIEWGWDGINPTNGIKKNREIKRDRFLTAAEMPKFIEALNQEQSIAREYFWILLLTGARKSNVLSMRWDDIDFNNSLWRIPETKNGEPLVLPLIPRAIDILNGIPRVSQWVFTSPNNPEQHFVDPKKAWQRILQRAGIDNLRIHDIRRTLGSWQALTGASLLVIGKSLGHKSIDATKIYARLQTDPVRNSIQIAVDKMLEYK
jgi:integrase